MKAPNDIKLSECGAGQDACMAGSAGAGSMPSVAVRCCAWLGRGWQRIFLRPFNGLKLFYCFVVFTYFFANCQSYSMNLLEPVSGVVLAESGSAQDVEDNRGVDDERIQRRNVALDLVSVQHHPRSFMGVPPVVDGSFDGDLQLELPIVRLSGGFGLYPARNLSDKAAQGHSDKREDDEGGLVGHSEEEVFGSRWIGHNYYFVLSVMCIAGLAFGAWPTRRSA